MAFGRPPLSRRALLAATLSAIYALLLLPTPGSVLGINVYGLAWFLLALGLLFLTPLAYHAISAFSILWIIWKGINFFQGKLKPLPFIIDMAFPIAVLILLFTSGYLEQARAFEAERE